MYGLQSNHRGTQMGLREIGKRTYQRPQTTDDGILTTQEKQKAEMVKTRAEGGKQRKHWQSLT
jgi:hypothetical protein